jgi:hypothetical protein
MEILIELIFRPYLLITRGDPMIKGNFSFYEFYDETPFSAQINVVSHIKKCGCPSFLSWSDNF